MIGLSICQWQIGVMPYGGWSARLGFLVSCCKFLFRTPNGVVLRDWAFPKGSVMREDFIPPSSYGRKRTDCAQINALKDLLTDLSLVVSGQGG